MPTYTHVQLSPLAVSAAMTPHRIHTDAADHVMDICYYAPAPCRVMKMLWQITETIDTPTISAVIALATGDRAGAMVAHIIASETTVPDNAVAADTIYEVEIPGGYAIAEGTSVVAILHTAGTGGGPAGIVKVWAVIQPSEL